MTIMEHSEKDFNIENKKILITKEQLKKIMPLAKLTNIEKYLIPLNDAMEKFEINTPKRIAAFLSQIALESGELKFDTELPSKYNGFDFSKYDGRKSLGNNQPGDGVKYKGRGVLQLTGRFNYTSMTKKLNAIGIVVNLVDNPELATRPDISAIIAAQYFKDHKLNSLADSGDVVGITRAVNGPGMLGLDRRIAYYNRAVEVLS